ELVVGWNEIPGRVWSMSAIKHVLNRLFVVPPPLPVSPVVGGNLVMLHWVMLALLESLQLGLAVDVQEELRHPNAVLRQHAFECVDLVVGPSPFLLAGEALDPLYEHAAVPTSIEDGQLALVW